MRTITRRGFVAATALGPLSGALSGAADSGYKVGITSNTIGGWEKDPFVGFREARAVGYHYVESFVQYFPEYYPDNPDGLRKRLDEIGVGLVTLSNGGAATETHFEDPAKQDKIVADHLRLARFIKPFGCDHLKINCGPRPTQGTTAEDLNNMAKVLDRLGRAIRDEGMNFAVHAHMWSQFENRREIDYIMQHTDPKNVKFVLDTGHITMAGMDPVELARALGHRVVEFHLKDTQPQHRGGAKTRIDRPNMMKDPPFFPLGSGGVNFPALKTYLDGIDWRGWLTVELDSSPFHEPKESARISRDYIRDKLGIPI
ncbi:MAG: sugar phosphate isomerase/epimerase family protein [Bryobacteraceae bacterium]